MGWIVIGVLAYLTFAYSIWFAPLLLVVGFLKYYRWNRYNSRPWRRVHFKMMKVQAMASGVEMNESAKEGRDFSFEKSLVNMVKLSGIDFESSPEIIVESQFRACENFEDEPFMRDWMNSAKDSSVSQQDIDSSIDGYRTTFTADNKGLMIRMIIAATIEKLYSKSDRAEYLFEVMNGKAT